MSKYPYLDSSVSVKNNLYYHVNGTWIKNNKIPKDRSADGTFYETFEKKEQQIKKIIEECCYYDNQNIKAKIGYLYKSFMDKSSIAKTSNKHLFNRIKKIQSLSTYQEVINFMSYQSLLGIDGFYNFYVSNNPSMPEYNILHIFQSGLGLPDKTYYNEDKLRVIYRKYKQYLEKIFHLSGINNPAVAANDLLRLETSISKYHWSQEDNRDSHKTNNVYTLKYIKNKYPYLHMWIQGLNLEPKQLEKINLAQPSFFHAMESLFLKNNLSIIKLLLISNTIRSYAGYCTEDFVSTNFEFYSKVLSGIPEMRARWKRGVSVVESMLGDAVGKIYVEKYFSKSSKHQVENIVQFIIRAYRESIVNLSWMSQDTKKNAIAKLDKFIYKIGYPENWKDYSKVNIISDSILENIDNINMFEINYQFSKLGKKVDKLEWLMNPQDINAYYHPTRNEIVFPAAILSSPFFYYGEENAAHNFGAIGAIIGHEISHGFDDQGSHYDGNGKLENWWNSKDYNAFKLLTLNLVNQYNQLSPSESRNNFVNGKLTLGENIGDLSGLGIAYKAYKIYLNAKKDKTINNITGDQRFFYAWASIWRSMIRPNEAINRLITDPHAPNEFRCNQIVKNIDSFYSAFNVKEGDAMWLDPKDRVKIW